MYPNRTAGGLGWLITDDADYLATPLTDAEFAAALPAGVASMHPELGWTADTLAPR